MKQCCILKLSSRKVSMRDIGCLFIPRITGLRDDGVRVSGFTLVELLVVVLIIGVLTAIALPQYEKTVERSKATQAFTLLNPFIQAYQAYYLENGNYAANFDELPVSLPANFTGDTNNILSNGE